MRQQISKTADAYAAHWLDQLMRGHLGLHEVPFAFAAWYNAGVAEGRAARQTVIDDLNHQLDVLYMQILTPQERQAEYRRRLEEHHEREAEEFFGNTAHHTLHSLRSGTSPLETGVNHDSSSTTERHRNAA